jgi:hypothetical protein
MTNDNGIFDVVSENEILQRVKLKLGISDTPLHDAYLYNSLNDKVRQLRNFFVFPSQIAQIPIDLTTFTAPLPKGFIILEGHNPIRTFKALNDINSTAPYAPTTGFYKGDFNNNTSARVKDNYIWFGSAIEDLWCEISYIGINTDENGDLVLPRVADLCLTFGVCADFCLERGDPSQMAKYATYVHEYKVEKRYIRGLAAENDAQDTKRVADINNKFAFKTY